MKLKLKSLLKDKNVLYIVFFLALVNLFGFLMLGNMDAVMFFLVVGFLTSYFSKNMIIIMLVTIILTNFFISSRHLGNRQLKEGFDEKKEKNGSSPPPPAPADEKLDEEEATGKPKVDYASTLEAAYDNIDKLLSSDALSSMSNETQRLAEKQQKLMGNIQKLEPMMAKAGSLLEGLNMDKMEKMMETVGGQVNKLTKKS